MKFNERLKMLRKELGITQKELAEKIGVGRTTISEYESGKIVPKQDGLISLADVFGVSVDYLTGVSDKPVAVFRTETNTYNMQLDDVLLGAIKMISAKIKSDDENFKIKYIDKELSPEQLYLIREHLRCSIIMIESIIKLDL